MRDRLIVWYDKAGRIKGAFSSVEEASAASGIKEIDIKRNLAGRTTTCGKSGMKFAYEVLASDFRKNRRN